MALARMERLQILAYEGLKMELLSCLQDLGVVQLEEARLEEVEQSSFPPELSRLEHVIFRLRQALDYLSHWEKRGFAEKLFSPKPQIERSKMHEILNSDYLSILEVIEKLQARKNDLISDIRFLEKEIEFLDPLESLDLPISELKATETSEISLGSLPFSQLPSFQSLAEEEALWFEVIRSDKRQCFLLVIYLRNQKEFIEERMKELGFVHLYLTEPILKRVKPKDRVRDVLHEIRQEIEKNREQAEALDREGEILTAHREKLMKVYDVLINEREKFSSSRLLGDTERTFLLEGWLRAADVETVKTRLQPYADLIEIYFRPPFPDEDPPVILKNPRQAQPFEVITNLYGLPQRNSFDPTRSLAPFFFVFVGLAVSEAGYGLLLAILSLLYIKYAKPKGNLLQFMKLLVLLGISNIILGTLVGGWFGFPIRKLMLIDPLQNPISFLVLSLVLGFIQVWFGTLLKMLNGIKNKLYTQSIFVQGGWLLLLPSLVVYLLTKKPVWGILSLLGASGVVFFAAPHRNPLSRFFGGLYSLYDISRYLADTLSYSRLLALGLSTSVIAMVVNTLCHTALGFPWVGWLFAALIFVAGHLFNMGISFLGGFVHSMRLQFVEFFTKFFKAGGRPFKAFALESKFVEFV